MIGASLDSAAAKVCLVLFCAFWSGIAAGQPDTKVIKPEIGESDGRRVTRFVLNGIKFESGWCGNEQLALDFHGQDGGIRLLTIASGQLRQITNDTYHAVVTCTLDSRYVFFTDRRSGTGLQVMDVTTGQRKTVSAKLPNGYMAIEEARARVAPSGRYIVGIEAKEESVFLTDRSVKRVQLPPPAKNDFANGIAWTDDERVYLLVRYGRSGNKLLEIEAKTSQHRWIHIPPVRNYAFGQIVWFPIGQELYLHGWPDNDEKDTPAVFRWNPRDQRAPPKVIVRDTAQIALRPNGTVLYEQVSGVEFHSDSAVIKDRNAARRELISQSAAGVKKSLMGVPYLSTALRPLLISPDGKKILVVERKLGVKEDQSKIVIFDLEE